MRIERARDDNFIDNSRTVLSNLLIFCNKKGRLLILMKIQYLGHSSFMLSNAKTSVVIDPFSASVGFPFPKVTADTVTISHHHDDHDSVEGVSGSPVVFDIPGEYERKGVRMYGYSTFHDEAKGSERGKNTMFKFVMDGVVILHCGDLGHELSDNDLELVKDTNILMIPINTHRYEYRCIYGGHGPMSPFLPLVSISIRTYAFGVIPVKTGIQIVQYSPEFPPTPACACPHADRRE